MLVSGRCWGWVAGRVGVRSWSGDEGVEIVARQIGGDGDVWEWWRCGCEVVTKEGTGEVWGWWWYGWEGVTKQGRCHI